MIIKSITERGINRLNEDSLLINKTKHIFGVFDGASSLTKYVSTDGKTGGYIASNIAIDTFYNSDDEELSDTALRTNQLIEEAHIAEGIDTTKSVNRFCTTAAVVRISNNKAELLQIGDSIILIKYSDGHSEVPLEYTDHDINVMRKWHQLEHKGSNNTWELLQKDIQELRETANKDYGVLNGDINVSKFLKTTTIDLSNVELMLLLTDGMYLPKQNPDEPENWDEFLALYEAGGLGNIYQSVRQIEKTDPELIKYPRYKISDDATAIAIEFS